MDSNILLQLIQIVITLVGLFFIWFQIKRGHKDTLTSSFINSLSDRWLAIENRKMSLGRVDEVKIYYKFLIPVLDEILETKFKNDLLSFNDNYIFNDDDRKINDKEKIFNIVIREYADIDALFNLCEEEYIVGKHLNLVDNKLWKYWEFYIRMPFDSKQMRNYWDLRLKVGAAYPDFIRYVQKNYLNKNLI